MSSPNQDGQLTTGQVAEQLGVAPVTVRRYITSGLLPEPGWTRKGMRKQRSYSHDWVQEAQKTLQGDTDD